jgi:GGDEF domain-containing protein
VTTTDREAEPVLAPLVESLRAAVGAHTVCLLVQEDVVLEYRIRAIASRSANVQRSGVFSTGDPLLTASMSREPISVRRIDGGRDVVAGYLRYYDDPPAIDHIALAPIPLRDDPSTTFLLVDATEEGDLGAPHARTLIEHFAQTLSIMLQEGATTPSDSSETLPGNGGPTTTQTPRVRESDPVEAHEPAEAAQGPRPRREIIAEEIERADDTDSDLALVLVHLNRAEAIERGGAAAVESAEHALRRRLEEAAPDQRVERFGELTYGVFYRAGIDEVETWAADLHDAMQAATGELEGGASIGAALLADRHESPDDLRDDATRALREAYETGACTIVE